MERSPTFWLALAVLLALLAVPGRASAQIEQCPAPVANAGFNNLLYLPGTQPQNMALCIDEETEILVGQAYSCQVAIWRPIGLFETLPRHTFYIQTPAYASTTGPTYVSFTVQAWVDSNIFGEEIYDYSGNWQYEATSYNANGEQVDRELFLATGWDFREIPNLGDGEAIFARPSVVLNTVSGGYTKIQVSSYFDSQLPTNSGLNVAHSSFVHVPDGFTPSEPCPYPGTPAPAPITPTATPTGTLTPTPTGTPTLTPSPTPTGTLLPTNTPTNTPTPLPTSVGLTAVPTSSPTPYYSEQLTPQPTYTPYPAPTINIPSFSTPRPPNLPPINVAPPVFSTFESSPPTLPTLAPLIFPTVAISTTWNATNTSMISRTESLSVTLALTPDATRQAGIISATQWLTNTSEMATGWISATGESTAWITGNGISGTTPISSAILIGQTVAAPISAVRGLQLYMPNLWPFILALLLLLAWVVLNLLAKFALGVFSVIYKLVDTLIRWIIPGLG